MLFSSIEYFLFFGIIVLLLIVLPKNKRLLTLFTASLCFYGAWKVEYLLLIITSILANHALGISISQAVKNKKKRILIFGIVFNFSSLFVFKYFNFSIDLLRSVSDSFSSSFQESKLDLLLPVGISFYTFQAVSYLVDIYRGDIQPEKKILNFGVYLSFFPQLVAGPIERAKNFIPQFQKQLSIKYENLVGVKLIIFGLFKKIVVADRIAQYTNYVYDDPSANAGFPMLIGVLFFSFQIYYDFSGYSDMAIGSARILGINLSDNFKRPYSASSVKEFWARWHITLSTWFKDYLYIPLGGNRHKKPRFYFNLLFTFVVSGLWHGANITFLFWGFIHGILLVLESACSSVFKNMIQLPAVFNRFRRIISMAFVFSLMTIAWVFFRSENIEKSFLVLESASQFNHLKDIFIFGKLNLIISFILIAFVQISEYAKSKPKFISSLKPVYKTLYYYLLIWIIVLFGVNTSAEFIYFQF